MRIVGRKKSNGTFYIKQNKGGSISQLTRNKNTGYGMGEEIMDNLDKKKTPLGHLTQKQDHKIVKLSKGKKYISLNL